MTTRHSGYLVVLDENIREDDAPATIQALLQIKGVLNVTPVPSSPEGHIAYERAFQTIQGAVYEAFKTLRDESRR